MLAAGVLGLADSVLVLAEEGRVGIQVACLTAGVLSGALGE